VLALKRQKAGALAVAQAQTDLLSAEQTLKNLNQKQKTAGGFTLQQLFQEAGQEFATYGSNIGDRAQPLSSQDARASFAGTVKTSQTTVVQNFWGERSTAQAMNDARASARNLR